MGVITTEFIKHSWNGETRRGEHSCSKFPGEESFHPSKIDIYALHTPYTYSGNPFTLIETVLHNRLYVTMETDGLDRRYRR